MKLSASFPFRVFVVLFSAISVVATLIGCSSAPVRTVASAVPRGEGCREVTVRSTAFPPLASPTRDVMVPAAPGKVYRLDCEVSWIQNEDAVVRSGEASLCLVSLYGTDATLIKSDPSAIKIATNPLHVEPVLTSRALVGLLDDQRTLVSFDPETLERSTLHSFADPVQAIEPGSERLLVRTTRSLVVINHKGRVEATISLGELVEAKIGFRAAFVRRMVALENGQVILEVKDEQSYEKAKSARAGERRRWIRLDKSGAVLANLEVTSDETDFIEVSGRVFARTIEPRGSRFIAWTSKGLVGEEFFGSMNEVATDRSQFMGDLSVRRLEDGSVFVPVPGGDDRFVRILPDGTYRLIEPKVIEPKAADSSTTQTIRGLLYVIHPQTGDFPVGTIDTDGNVRVLFNAWPLWPDPTNLFESTKTYHRQLGSGLVILGGIKGLGSLLRVIDPVSKRVKDIKLDAWIRNSFGRAPVVVGPNTLVIQTQRANQMFWMEIELNENGACPIAPTPVKVPSKPVKPGAKKKPPASPL